MAALSTLGYIALAASAAATVDANKAAQHQAKLQAEQQQKQLAEAAAMQQREMDMTARLQAEQLAAQKKAQAESMALAQKSAAESKALMDKQLKAADEAMNKAGAKRPNTARILDEASQSGKSGASGTMLTGSQGVDPSTLTLGKNTLLGA